MKTLLSLVFILSLAVALNAAPEMKPLAVGEPIPAVSVRNDAGEPSLLPEVIAGRPTVLIFYRGGWCPYCTRHLAAIAEVEGELRAAGYQLLALSPDRPEKLRARPSHEQLPYTLLSDSKADAARAFGIAFCVEDALVETYKKSYGIDLEADSGETHHLLPHPAVFIIDASGVVRFVHVNPDYKVRLTPGEILAAVRQLR